MGSACSSHHLGHVVSYLMHAQGTWRGLEVAIKRVIFQVLTCMGNEVSRMKALREAAINSTLNHPNIVSTYTHDMQPLGGAQNVSLRSAHNISIRL